MAWRAWVPDKPVRLWQGVVLGAALAGAATGIRLVLQAPLGRELPFITFFPALIVASALGGFAGGMACLAAATLGVLFLLTPLEGSAVWALGAFWIAGGLVVAVASAMADSVRELRASRGELTEAQGRLQTLVGELAHRSRNALFVIMSIVSQSARATQSAAEAEQLINARLQALVRAQDALHQADGVSVGLRPLLERALEPFDLKRIEIGTAPEIQVEGDVAVGLGLLFHELATNALKYGALSQPKGRILIAWTVDADFARFEWREVGGPPLAEPSKRGFGARLLEAALVPQGGKAERRFEPDGVVCELRIPRPSRAADPAALPGAVFASRAADEAPS
jgi:two-component sensor histidine kinase